MCTDVLTQLDLIRKPSLMSCPPLKQNYKTQHLLSVPHGFAGIWMLLVSFIALVDADKGVEEKPTFYWVWYSTSIFTNIVLANHFNLNSKQEDHNWHILAISFVPFSRCQDHLVWWTRNICNEYLLNIRILKFGWSYISCWMEYSLLDLEGILQPMIMLWKSSADAFT